MKVLVASDSFKGTLSSREIGRIVQEELSPDHTVDYYAVSDGGEGFLDSLEGLFAGHVRTIPSKDPLDRDITCTYFLTDDHTAIIESASACGLGLLRKFERNPMVASTFGLGLLIRDALLQRAEKVYIGLGGSATNDGGIGMLRALGVKLKDSKDEELILRGGGELGRIDSLDIRTLTPRIQKTTFHAVCDVDNPLLGTHGATRVYGPQKGAGPDTLDALEAGMASFAAVVKKRTGHDYSHFPGAGAAGGLGFCLKSLFGAELLKGIEALIGLTGLGQIIHRYDLVLTGEGRLDQQTESGKVPLGLLRLGEKYHVPVICLCGIDESNQNMGFTKVFAVVPRHATHEESMSSPEFFLRKMIREEIREWLVGKG